MSEWSTGLRMAMAEGEALQDYAWPHPSHALAAEVLMRTSAKVLAKYLGEAWQSSIVQAHSALLRTASEP
jgi:hypothetical protein